MELIRSYTVNRLAQAVAALLMWALVGLIFASQLYFFARTTGYKTTFSYVFGWEVLRWCLWLLFVPWILRAGRSYPLQQPVMNKNIARHVLMSAAVALAHVIVYSLVYWTLKGKFTPDEFSRVIKYVFSVDFHLGIFVYWAIVVSTHALQYYRRASHLQLELTRAQLHALKMQIHPHFLFNTLNSISSLLHTNPELADEMVGTLGDFLRQTLQNSGQEMVPLAKEIEFLRCYLDIEQIRFQDRLFAEFRLEPETLDAAVPNLLLQPLIENAIKHGVADRPGHCLIEICSRCVSGKLHLTVTDDGPGLPAENPAEGIGISNTKARLSHLYGSNHHLAFANLPAGGMRVTVEIPLVRSNAVAGAMPC